MKTNSQMEASMKKNNNRYEVAQIGYYPDEWIDKDTGKKLNTWKMEKIVNKYYNELQNLEDALNSEIWHHEKVAKGNIKLKDTISKLCEKLRNANESIEIKDMLIAQLEDQNDRLIKERDELMVAKSNNHWKDRAENLATIVQRINNVLPNKQEDGIAYEKVVDDVVSLVDSLIEKEREIRAKETAIKTIITTCCNNCPDKIQAIIGEFNAAKKFIENNAFVSTFPNAYDGYYETEPYVEKADILAYIDKRIELIKALNPKFVEFDKEDD